MLKSPCFAFAAAIVLCFTAFAGAQAGTAPDANSPDANAGPIFDIPRMDSVVVDGNAADWGDGGFRIDLLMPVVGDLRPAKDHAARVRLGWNDKGLLLLAFVQGGQWVEGADTASLWKGDAIEVFLAPKKGHKDCCQWCISPGMASQFPQPRWGFHEGRSKELQGRPTDLTVARTKVPGGYVLEALLPFASLDIKPQLGAELGFQVWSDDAAPGKDFYWAAWYPGLGTLNNHQNMHRIRLADKPGAAEKARALGAYDMDRLRLNFTVLAQGDQAGKEVRFLANGTDLGKGTLALDEAGRAIARVSLPLPPVGKPCKKIVAQLDGKDFDTPDLPSPDVMRAEAFVFLSPVAKPCVFSASAFPAIEFEQPLLVEGLMGRYELKSTFYDSNYQVVTSADSPGRYGAVVEIRFQDSRVYRRFLTLFRTKDDLVWWRAKSTMTIDWPHEMGVPAAAIKHGPSTGETLKWNLVDSFSRDGEGAVLLAGLYETKDSDSNETYYTAPDRIDRQWWVGLKRKLYGFDAKYPKPFARPFKTDGPPATVVHEGTLAQAGMKPDAAEKIDAVLTEWSKDTDEAFAVCIVRHGVIVLHKAYGIRDGRPMTVADKSQMASATKCISGSMMLMLIDQGLLDLDRQAGDYLPPLAGLKGANGRPLTIRNLYNHTSGFKEMWHFGDEMNDMEERMAVMVPQLRVGEAAAYNGAGMELACKFLEAASGQSLPEFYRTRLLEPLGCADLFDAGRASYGTRAAPLALARILQMILNKGAYGNWRFFSPETYKQLLPVDMEAATGVKPAFGMSGYGMGTTWFFQDGLSRNCFGHGAASAATIRIDPDNDLAIVMTRNNAGNNFGKYHSAFIRAITAGMIDPASTQPTTGKAEAK